MDGNNKVIAYRRWGRDGSGDSVLVVANFSTQPVSNYTIGFPAKGTWNVRFNSDSKGYDTEFANMGNANVEAVEPGQGGQPCKGAVDIAPYSALVLSQDRPIN